RSLRQAGQALMNGRSLRLATVLVAAAASSALWAHLRADETVTRYGGQAQQRAANPDLLRFCPGSGIPCVEITREAYDRGHDQFRSSCGFCHGPTAAGGNGRPNLIFSSVIRLDEKGVDITRLI